MKKFRKLAVMLIIISTLSVNAQLSGGGEANPTLLTNKESLKAFQDLRFGMFIHWGPVTLRGTEIGWSRSRQVPIADYDQLYTEFNPVLFNAQDWVKAAKEAGMKYIVLTTRHHDGFSLWDSQYSDYDMASTPYGKGIVKELADESRKQGLEFGIYYSICDWWHEDYPNVRTADEYIRDQPDHVDPKVWVAMDRYRDYMKNQLTELIDLVDPNLIWFDGGWEWPWTHEMGMDMYAFLRAKKDNILINNRVDKALHGVTVNAIPDPEKFAGDYQTPEQRVGAFNVDIPWETCMTIAKQWAWKANDELKSKKECIQTLVRTVGGNGNLLFNVGPMADGRIEQRQIARLKEMGAWLATNGEAIYGTRGGPYMPNDYMVSTHKDNKIYLQLLKRPDTGKIVIPFSKDMKLQKAYFLEGNKALHPKMEKERLTIELPLELPNEDVTVVVLEINRPTDNLKVFPLTNY